MSKHVYIWCLLFTSLLIAKTWADDRIESELVGVDGNSPLEKNFEYDVGLMLGSYKGAPQGSIQKIFKTPTVKVEVSDWPDFDDDLDFDGMNKALERQIRRYKQRRLAGLGIELGGKVYPVQKVLDSLILFRSLTSTYRKCLSNKRAKAVCKADFENNLKSKFLVFAPQLQADDIGYGEEEFARFTAYYTPLIDGSFVQSKKYPHAIYKKPSESLRRSTRVEIDFDKVLARKGYELFYTKDLFELYLLHVQGGGKVRVQNQETWEEYYISYSATNNQRWDFISLYMREQGYISDLSIESQRDFLIANPDKQREIYEYCPSYVYFKISQTPPEGSDLVPLTDGRSIATDHNHYGFKGMLSFVQAKRPKSSSDRQMKDFSRFFLDQDTGGAIRGRARVDIYHGEGEYAEHAAYNTDVRGKLFFLIMK